MTFSPPRHFPRVSNIAPVILLLSLFAHSSLTAQGRQREVRISVFNNAIGMPFSGKAGIFHAPLHPGLSAGFGKRLNTKANSHYYYMLNLAYVYQQRVQHGIQLYGEIGYRYQLKGGFGMAAELGGGYMHAFRELEQFELNDNGIYEKVPNTGRPAVMFSLAPTLSYDLTRCGFPVRPFLRYQLWFQTPFVRSYVPVLPNAALHVGAAVFLNPMRQP